MFKKPQGFFSEQAQWESKQAVHKYTAKEFVRNNVLLPYSQEAERRLAHDDGVL